MTLIEQLKAALIDGKSKEVEALVEAALGARTEPRAILDGGLIGGMEVVGERFRDRDIFLPDVLLAAKAMYVGLALLRPHLESGETGSRGTVVLGTVEGDLHDIGKNLVGIMLRGAGFNVVDLGQSVPSDKFVAAVREHNAGVIGMSALLTTTMPGMRKVVCALEKAGLEKVRIMVGGAPVTEAYARDIGAHAYGFDAVRAVELAKGFLS